MQGMNIKVEMHHYSLKTMSRKKVDVNATINL